MGTEAFRSIFSMELRKALSYRFDFWVQFLGTVIVQIVVAWFLWGAVFQARGVTEIGGYAFAELMFYYLLVPLIDRLNRGYDNFAFSTEIYDGSLTRYLLYPVSFFALKFTGQLARAVISFLQLALGVAAFAVLYGLPESYQFSLASTLMGFGLCFLAMVCYFLLASTIEMVAFWADNVWSLMVILRFAIQIMGGALLPLELFPTWARTMLELTPFPHLLYAPTRLLMGQGGLEQFGHSALVLGFWTMAFALICQRTWRAGTREYSGVGV